MTIKKIVAAILLIVIAVAACNNNSAKESKAVIEAITPGLGEYMSMVEYHHTNLKKSIDDDNLQRSSYELDELMEVFEKAQLLHNNHEKLVQPLSAQLNGFMYKPIKELQKSIEAKDSVGIKNGYKIITANCNNCHQVNNMKYIKIAE